MTTRETCAACRKPRATMDDHMGRGCTVSEYGSLCHATDDDACAERRGGWRAIAEDARDVADAFRDEAATEPARIAAAEMARDVAWVLVVADDELFDAARIAVGLGIEVDKAEMLIEHIDEGRDIAAAIRAARGAK